MQRLQDISEVSVLSIGQIQELLFVQSHEPAYRNVLWKKDTNLGDLDLDTLSLIVNLHDIYIIVRTFRITPFVLTRQ